MKPVSGGRPPRENIIRGMRAVIIGVFAHEAARRLIDVILLIISARNADRVIIR